MIGQSESISELATALSKAQSQMGAAIKDSENPFFKSKYADLTSVIAAVRKPFADNGLSFVQLPVSQDDDGNSAIIDYQKDYSSSIDAILTGIADGDLSSAAEEWFTLPKHVQEALWVAPSKGGSFSTKDREVMKSSDFRAAYYGEGK